MKIKILKMGKPGYPAPLANIHSPPDPLYVIGKSLSKLMHQPRLAIVGTRKMTIYGKKVTTKLAADLAEQGIVIISGLAFGVDVLAHQTALQVGGTAIAVLPGPLDNILPPANQRVAQQILDQGGTLISEKPPGSLTFKQDFIARNRLVTGLADAVLIIEAAQGSGTFHTAAFARSQNRDLLAVPGNIDSPASFGTNNMIKEGAQIVTSYIDVMRAMGLTAHHTPIKQVRGRNPEEQKILELILSGINEGEKLQQQSGLDIVLFNQTLTMLEISGKIRPLGANQWSIT